MNGTLVMPKNFVAVNSEEMEYLDGGVYFSKQTCRNVIASFLMTPAGIIAAAATTAVVAKMINWGKSIGGVVSWVIGTAAAVLTLAMAKIATGLGRGALNNGVNISGTLAWWNYFVDVSW